LGTRTREFSRNSLQTPIPHKEKTLSRLVVRRLRTTLGERLTGWFTAASPMAPDRTAAATLCCCVSVWRRAAAAAAPGSSFSFVACDASSAGSVGKGMGRMMMQLETGVVPKLRNRGKGLTLCSFSGRKILRPSLGWRPVKCGGGRTCGKSTAFYILLVFLLGHPATLCELQWCLLVLTRADSTTAVLG